MPLRRLPKALLHVQLTRHTTPGHYLAFLLASLVLISQFVFANSTQPYLLTEFFHVPPSKAGQWNAWLLLADQLISVAMLGIWGCAFFFFLSVKMHRMLQLGFHRKFIGPVLWKTLALCERVPVDGHQFLAFFLAGYL